MTPFHRRCEHRAVKTNCGGADRNYCGFVFKRKRRNVGRAKRTSFQREKRRLQPELRSNFIPYIHVCYMEHRTSPTAHSAKAAAARSCQRTKAVTATRWENIVWSSVCRFLFVTSARVPTTTATKMVIRSGVLSVHSTLLYLTLTHISCVLHE